MTDKKDGQCDESDVAFLGPPAPGGGVHVLRHRSDHSMETGVLRPLEDGRPIHGEIVQIRKRENGPGFDVLPPEDALAGQGGPPMVNSQAYKDGWDTIFGKKTPAGEA